MKKKTKAEAEETRTRELFRLVYRGHLFADFDFNDLSEVEKEGWLRLAKFVMKLEGKRK